MLNRRTLPRRTFICVDFPSEIIKEIARVQNVVLKRQFTGKLTEPENLHLTLKFLGEIDEKTLNDTKEKLSMIKVNTLNLKLHGVGTFNFKKNPKIVWIKVTGNIFTLQKQIDEVLSNIFPKEDRFMSHLTIARIKHVKTPDSFIKYMSNIKPKPLKFTIDNFKLKSSNLLPSGPIYTTLEKYKLD